MAVTAMPVGIKQLDNRFDDGPAAASTTCYRRAIVMRDGSGNIKNGATAVSCMGIGVAAFNDGAFQSSGTDPNVWDNSTGNAGDIRIKYEKGIWGPFANSGTSITAGMETKACYIVDNVTVHATSNAGARSPAGIIHRVATEGVYVLFDEDLVREAAAVSSANGSTYTQTYSTANRTVAAPTATSPAAATVVAQTAVTDNGGGEAADGTIAVLVDAGGTAAGAPTTASVANAIKELSTKVNLLVIAANALAADRAATGTQVTALVADDLDNRQSITALIDDGQAAGIWS